MRVLIVDQENLGLDFALRCAEADHDVRWYKAIDHGHKWRDGEGFKGIDIVEDWRPHMKWARDGLILTTGNFKFLHELDRYRDLGFKIFSPTVKSAALEIQRSVGLEAMKAAGIDVPPYQVFKSLEDAERFARKSDKAWVFKTMGDESDKSLSYVSSDPADMVGWIRQKIARGMVLKGPCLLQEKIDMLAEVGVSGWFGPDGFLPNKWQVCFEHKKLMDGEIGPNTGEAGTVTQYVETDKLANEMLLPMVGALRASGHRGDFAIGAGIDKSGKAWPFEFTARLGWPAFFIQCASHKGDSAQWMRDLLDGHDTLKVSRDAAIGVVMGQPMYPYQKSTPELVEGNPISIEERAMDDVHMVAVMVGKGPKMEDGKIVERPIFQTTGEYVLVCTGLGKTVEQARKRVYRTVDDVSFPNSIFRRDIGQKLEKCLPALHGFGYVKDLQFS